MGAVGQNIPHDSARGHVSGESVFIDDMPPLHGEVLVDFAGSPVAHGRLKSVDTSVAAKIPGVVALFTAKDVPGHNHFGPVIADEHLLVKDEAVFVGDPVVLIAAENRRAIDAARKAIKIEMEPLPPIFSIDDAIAQQNFIGPRRYIRRGNLDQGFAAAKHVIESTLTIGGQEQFYLESQIALAVPGEFGQMTVHSSTQHPSEVQAIVAEVLGVRFNQVVVICKRMGGGFGGKETQAAGPAAMAAMVAATLRRPARIAYTKDDDMRVTGKRHPFKTFYKVGFDDDGRIVALDIQLYSNGGCSTDLSMAVLERAMLHTDNAYYLPNVCIAAQVCKTNLPSNTAFRGFGGPQGVIGIENILEEIGIFLRKDALDVRQANVYTPQRGMVTPYGQTVQNNTSPRIFEELRRNSDYDRRRREIDAFNAASETHVRGMSMSAVKFGISFTKKTLNQANALVNIYLDGTVMVSTGGTEMGQGVNTRVRQIVADELGVLYDDVIVAPTSTDKNNNTSPTAASSGTDLNGAAAVDACSRLRDRLTEFAAGEFKSPASNIVFRDGFVFDGEIKKLSFKELVCRAYIERVNMGERGFYATPGIDFDRETGTGTPFLYYTNGAAASEVLIDRLTGEMKILRVDLLMDIGLPINPGLDCGQVVGGFIQGVGWCTNEELKYSEKGDLLSHSPTTYKIPNIGDLPEIFNVHMLDNPDNAVSLRRSKAVGEPPLLLGLSAWTAVKSAIASANDGTIPDLVLPATGEQILLCLTRQSPRTITARSS